VLKQIRALLPPHARACPADAAHESFGILSESDGSYRFERGDSPVTRNIDLGFALMLMESQLRIYVGIRAPERIFVHAGVVEHHGRALLAPGLSFAGKTTLVTALVRAGATYLSDDYAVIDPSGLVHPFAKPLSIRDDEHVQNHHDVERLGGRVATEPVPIGAVVFTEYRAGAPWRPRQVSPGRGVLAVLQHTLAARERSKEALPVLRRALAGAVLLEGARGEAEEIAGSLLAMVSQRPLSGAWS
jgi:hypothetical protein